MHTACPIASAANSGSWRACGSVGESTMTRLSDADPIDGDSLSNAVIRRVSGAKALIDLTDAAVEEIAIGKVLPVRVRGGILEKPEKVGLRQVLRRSEPTGVRSPMSSIAVNEQQRSARDFIRFLLGIETQAPSDHFSLGQP